ncbi:hypothetical protein [Geitlerinema sp. PCC 9228]|jgi:hypothetical protein|uniref:hypothetical protein n=1 Tax=Geitlerinema sp. PCC 9228 TaxID=111611 RepID=UPI0008F9CBEE|nr:hypothetical protein [Geitlerinema sp. PCC 9228]
MQRYFQEANRHSNQDGFFCDRVANMQKKSIGRERGHRRRQQKSYRDEREINELLDQLPQMLDSLESFRESK